MIGPNFDYSRAESHTSGTGWLEVDFESGAYLYFSADSLYEGVPLWKVCKISKDLPYPFGWSADLYFAVNFFHSIV